jgi:hypothetical protein
LTPIAKATPNPDGGSVNRRYLSNSSTATVAAPLCWGGPSTAIRQLPDRGYSNPGAIVSIFVYMGTQYFRFQPR